MRIIDFYSFKKRDFLYIFISVKINFKREKGFMNIRKICLSIGAILFFALNTVQVQAVTLGVGVSMSANDLTTLGKEDIDNNGTTTTTKTFADSVTAGSIFVETTFEFGTFGLTFGLDYIPVDADIDKRSITQSSLKTAGTTATGTNSARGTISQHKTLYIQPGIMFGSNILYGTWGYATADVEGTTDIISSTNLKETKSLNGTKVGFGVKHVRDNGIFIKADYSETDYDSVSWVTSNSTKGTADIDNESFAISLGKQF